jgi:hypothetical protein
VYNYGVFIGLTCVWSFILFLNCNIETKTGKFTCVCYSQDQWWFAELLMIGLRLGLLYD